jgi:2-isopropylmalate synthase
VGNDTRILISELAGRRNILAKMEEQGIDIPLEAGEVQRLLDHVKLMESRGYQYEGAEASFELLVRRGRPDYEAPFELEDFMVVERRHYKPGEADREMLSEAMVKIAVDDEIYHTAAEGSGPVHALDTAIRKALVQHFPSVSAIKLVDYKVRIIDSTAGAAANVRVLIESTDGEDTWTTVGSSTDIIEASWIALSDSLEYWLLKRTSRASDKD